MRSNEINLLAEALAKAQSKVLVADKDCVNPFFKSKYANFPNIWNACRNALGENNFSVSQIVWSENGSYYLTTLLMHSSGQWLESKMLIPTGKGDIQSLGSSITYCKRYALAGIVGVCSANEDDDGETAMDRNGKKQLSSKEKFLSFVHDINPELLEIYISKIIAASQGKMNREIIMQRWCDNPAEMREHFEKNMQKLEKEVGSE